MSIAITHEQRAVQESIRRWAATAATLTAVRAGGPDGGTAAWQPHWAQLARLGVAAIALPEAVGGAGGTVTDLAAALEQVTDALVPGPILPTLLAGLLLAEHAGRPAVAKLLTDMARGDATVAVARDPGTVAATSPAREPRATRGGPVFLDGQVGPVLGAGATSHLLLAAAAPDGVVWFLLAADHPGIRVTPRLPVDFSRSLADVELRGAQVPAELRLPAWRSAATDPVNDTAALLAAVEAAAVAAWSVRAATEYAKVRRQFDRPIGSFQAVQHLCAQMLCRAERAAAVAWDAARAFDEAPDEFPLAAAAAAAVALDAGVDNAKDCIQVLGGIGFTWEHDAHLYLRRAVALRQLLGGTAAWRHRAAALTVAGARRSPGGSVSAAGSADPQRLAIRARIGAIAALPPGRRRAVLADAGYLAPHWPTPYGSDAAPAQQLLIDEELSRAGVQRPDLAIAGWAVPTILHHGTARQRDRFAGPSLRGEITWCQLFSEPEAGSDLAALRTRAVPAPGGWRLTGQKVWTSLARQADWAICLARTHPDRPRHRGLTYFLVRMDSPGVTVRGLRDITGRSVFNEVFLDDVFVPDDCVVGAPGDGWRLARGTLADERVAIGRGPALGEDLEQLIGAARASTHGRDPDQLDRLGGLVADGLAVAALDLREALHRLDGGPGTGSAVAKLVGVAHRQAVAEAALLHRGPDGAADGPDAEPVHQFLLSRCLSIAGGTTQILLSVVAERILGLPREWER